MKPIRTRLIVAALVMFGLGLAPAADAEALPGARQRSQPTATGSARRPARPSA